MMLGMGPAEMIVLLITGLFNVVPFVLVMVLLILAIRWFLRHERQDRAMAKDPEVQKVRGSLAQVLRAHREACHMTQELVAQKLGVSRQAVSKWESGASEPSTTNLVRLAELFGMDAADLLREVEA